MKVFTLFCFPGTALRVVILQARVNPNIMTWSGSVGNECLDGQIGC